MPDAAISMLPLADWATQFIIIIGRLSFIVFLMPGIGEQVVPTRTRLFLLLGMSVCFASAGVVAPISFDPFSVYFGTLLSEIFIGFALGVSLRLVIWLLSIVGSIIAQSIGLAQFLGIALEHEAQTITANMLTMAGVVLLLTANYHVNVFASVIGLYSDIPVGAVSNFDHALVMNGVYSAFAFAVLLAWPFVAVNLLYNVCLGFINKALPQMMVAFVGAPFMVGAGLFLFLVSFSSLLIMWKDRVPQLVGWL